MRVTRAVHAARERGAVAVMVAIVSVLLVVCVAFAVDLGYAWQVKRSMVKATDASALAAAHEARDQAAAKQVLGSGSCAPAAVQTAATDALDANRSDATMDFCAIANGAGAKNGVVTVRATTAAKMSFSKIIGFDQVTVHSSTSALWQQARLLPFAACAVKGNSSAADWAADPSTPTSVVLQASSADTSSLCSGGKSGAFGTIDLASAPATGTSFDACRTDDAAIATDLVGWVTNGYSGNIPTGAYRCATAGQYYGTASANVDRAICQIPQGSAVALPIVTVSPDKQNSSGSKQWIVQISGFALTSFDDYTGNQGADLCSAYRTSSGALGPAKHLPHVVPIAVHRRASVAGRVHARVHARRHATRTRRPHGRPRLVARPAITVTMSPASASTGQLVTGLATITNSGNQAWTGQLTLTFTGPKPATLNFFTNGSVCGYAAAAGTITCPGLQVTPPNGNFQVSFGATFSTAGPGTLSAVITNDNATGSASYTITDPTTTSTTAPSGKALVVTVAGAGTVTATPDGNQAVGTCTTAQSPCTFTYKNNTNVTLTQSAGPTSTFSGWSQGCSGTGACSVTISASTGAAVTATFGVTTTTVPPTTTTVPIGSYRELHITLQTLLTGSNLTSDDLTVYRICKVNVSTVSAATTLTCT